MSAGTAREFSGHGTVSGTLESWVELALSMWRVARQAASNLSARTASRTSYLDQSIWEFVAAVPVDTVAPARASQRSCRLCAKPGRRRVCAQCATVGFIELGCGCVERPDGTRYSCEASVHLGEAPIASGLIHGHGIQAAFHAWVDAANESAGEVCRQRRLGSHDDLGRAL